MNSKKTRILLTGPPGVGKTTVIKKVCDILKQKLSFYGFYTEELREGNHRQGFDVVTFDGKKCMLARKSDTLLISEKRRFPTVGQYSVYVNRFEEFVMPIMINSEERCVYIIDEIGKMELLSKKFASSIKNLFDKSESPILATIPSLQKGNLPQLIHNISSRDDVQVITISKANRNEMPTKIVNEFV